MSGRGPIYIKYQYYGYYFRSNSTLKARQEKSKQRKTRQIILKIAA
jgi:hypothetical protein